MPRVADLNNATQVSAVMVTAISADPANPDNMEVPVTSDTTSTTVIASIATAHARELVTVVQATVAMNVDINLISINGIGDWTASTTLVPAATPTRIVTTGLTTAAQIVARLAAAAPPVGTIIAEAYARA